MKWYWTKDSARATLGVLFIVLILCAAIMLGLAFSF